MQEKLSQDSPLDMPKESDVVYGVWVSFAEVYNECVFDLLDPILTRGRKRIPLRMAQDGEGIAFVKGTHFKLYIVLFSPFYSCNLCFLTIVA